MRPAKKMLTLQQINVQKLDASPMKGGRLDSTYIRNMANKELHGGFNDYSSNQLLDMTMDTGVGNQSRISSIPVSRESNRELGGAKSRRQSVMHQHGNSIILNEAQKKKLQGRLSIRPQGVSQRELMTKADAVSQFTDNKSRKSSRKSDHSAKATVKTRGAISKDTTRKK